jgi:TolB-like protein
MIANNHEKALQMKKTVRVVRTASWLQLLLLCVLVAGMAGCSARARSESFLRENVDISFVKKVAVLPFQNNSKDEFAPERIRDITTTQILAMGLFDVIDKGLVDSVLREEAIEPGKPVDRQALRRIGQRLGVEVVAMGTIDLSGENRKGAMVYPEISITLRLLEIQNGEVIWQGTGHSTGDSIVRRLFGLAAYDVYEVSLQLVKELLASIPLS